MWFTNIYDHFTIGQYLIKSNYSVIWLYSHVFIQLRRVLKYRLNIQFDC